MLYPSAEELTKNHQSRYSLVIATAKIARKIAYEAEANSVILMEKPVKTAVNKIAKGEIVFREKEDDYIVTPSYDNIAKRTSYSDGSDYGDSGENGDNSEE